MKKTAKVLVGMSGGVDSSVAALLLRNRDFDVTGAFMKNWSFPSGSEFAKDCTWKADKQMATRVAAKLNIPFLNFDFQKEYKKTVINYFFTEYKAGRTPNPDVMCNKTIKFDLFLAKAKSLGFDYIATGHYVRKKCKKDICYLCRGKDNSKDQSYFLWPLTHDQIKKSLFPIGEYTKKQIRKIAEKAKLPSAHKPDSQGICFVGEVDILKFLKTKLSETRGRIIYKDKSVGYHNGAWFFTIGQRRGLSDPALQKNLSRFFSKKDLPPFYVLKTDVATNQIWIGEDKALYKNEMIVENPYWVCDIPDENLTYQVQIRYQHKAVDCRISKVSKGKLKVRFKKPQRAITPGQSAVFYKDDLMLGGGIIYA